MCGICGQINFDATHTVPAELVTRMSDAMVHRGPDDSGQFISANVALGFRRLSIIDVDGGHQPMSNEDGSIWIVFNGEVYNFPELTRRLQSTGHLFKTRTDTEAILHLYEEMGQECVQELRGMFALAILDLRRKRLFCARDRMGIKPFYYYMDRNRFVFGSELKVVLAAGIPAEVDPQALEDYFTNGYVPAPRSIIRGVKKLPQAHTLSLDFGAEPQVKVGRYWDIRFVPDHSLSESDWLEALEAELENAVRMRLISDVPLGAFLSGGIDSSAVVALMSRFSTTPVKTFSIGFEEAAYDELPYARMIAAKYRTEHHEEIVRPNSVELLAELSRYYDEPFADSSAIPTYLVSRFARRHVTVVLSGDGGDELFAGYNHYVKWLRLHRFNRLPPMLAELVWGTAHRVLPQQMFGKGLTYYLSKNRHEVPAWFSLWMPAERRRLLGKQDGIIPGEENKLAILRHSTAPDFISRCQELDLHTYLAEDILVKVDRASMANSLEARVPLLDHKVAELSFRMPSSLKLRGGEKKYILRKCMANELPNQIMTHPKQGFGVPLKLWFRNELRELVEDRFSQANSPAAAFVDLSFARDILRKHQAGTRDFSHHIWSLLFLDSWLRELRGLSG